MKLQNKLEYVVNGSKMHQAWLKRGTKILR